MRFIKNFLDSLMDYVIVLVILALAAGIIYWRMTIILDYPKQLASEQAVYQLDESSEEETEDESTGEAEAQAEDAQADQAAEGAAEEPTG